MNNHNLLKFRDEIDRIDREILELIIKRAETSMAIGEVKRAEGLSIYDPGREEELIGSLVAQRREPLSKDAVRYIYREIIAACRRLQQPIRAAYLGPAGTFSHQAARQHFGQSTELSEKESIADVFQSVESGQSDYGLVPIENSNEGSVGVTLDRLLQSDLKICGEVSLRVSQALISKAPSLRALKEVTSHPQALGQCRKWLSAQLPGVRQTPAASTAAAACLASENPEVAALGSTLLADLYGLQILALDVQDKPLNLTRFVIIGRESARRTGQDKTSVWFATPHRPGALHETLQPLADFGLNMTRIESRPLENGAWEYGFFLDFSGHIDDESVRELLEKMKTQTVRLKILGSYPSARVEQRLTVRSNGVAVKISSKPSFFTA